MAQQLAYQLGRSRRDFLRDAAGLAVGSTLLNSCPLVRGAVAQKKRKTIVITFGGGARDQETFAPEGRENIPSAEGTNTAIELLYPGGESRASSVITWPPRASPPGCTKP